MTKVETRGTIRIDFERCKGCELCIPACPPRVLLMSEGRNQRGAQVPQLLPGCTGCQACLMVCPDFCIEVYQYTEPILVDVAEKSAAEVAT
jgi:2-oxoglutarate ferredoxin oxidoreductase subunit delta